uniref:Peptidase S1 domain-containing protein n=1 Tax=Glossina palpalis gambiensis TaxID=67801 RepID=A0A1B0C6Z7_9MUSC
MENFLKGFVHILLTFMAINFALTDYLNTNFPDNYTIESKQPARKVFGGYRKGGEIWGTYTALLVLTTGRAKYFGALNFCCGALVNVQTVITAGHCVDHLPIDLPKSSLRVIINAERRLRRTNKTLYKKVLKAVTHRQYANKWERGDNDIALLILYSPIKKRVDYLIPLNPPKNNMDCVATGWGQVFPDGPSPDRILFVDMRLTATTICNIVYGANNKHALCAKSPQSAKGLCKGDSGAPLFCNGNILLLFFQVLHLVRQSKARFPLGKIHGLLSEGASSCDDHEIYVNVYRHANWIKKNMQKIRRRAAKACQHACAPMLLFLPMFV